LASDPPVKSGLGNMGRGSTVALLVLVALWVGLVVWGARAVKAVLAR